MKLSAEALRKMKGVAPIPMLTAYTTPTIGIGAGAACDGQVLVVNDAIGLGERWPVFSKQYAYVSRTLTDVARDFMAEVREGTFVENVLTLNASRKE